MHINTLLCSCDFDDDFGAWVESTSLLINEYCDAFHADDEEARIEDASHLCIAADHLWRERGGDDPAWSRLDVAALLVELDPPEGPMPVLSTLVGFVAFLCQRNVLTPAQTVKLLSDIESCVEEVSEGRPVVWTAPLGRWAKIAQA